MEFTKIITNSKWKENLIHEYIVQGSDTLVVTLPGYAYDSLAPLLYYTGNATFENGCDLLCIEYGYRKKQVDISLEDELKILAEETKEAIDKALDNGYKGLILVGKSLGTFIMNEIRDSFKQVDTFCIYMTPTDKSIPKTFNQNSLVIYGTGDKSLSKENMELIKSRNDLEYMEVPDADHSLEYDDTARTIETHLEIIKRCGEFINESKHK